MNLEEYEYKEFLRDMEEWKNKQKLKREKVENSLLYQIYKMCKESKAKKRET